MLKTIIDKLTEELKNNGVENVYTCFDNVPINKKGNGIFTVAGVDSFESSSPIYSKYVVYLPFKSEAAITLIAPQDYTMAELYDYFDKNVLPIIKNTGSMTCTLRNLTMKNDANINRMTLKMRLSVSGISRIERSSS